MNSKTLLLHGIKNKQNIMDLLGKNGLRPSQVLMLVDAGKKDGLIFEKDFHLYLTIKGEQTLQYECKLEKVGRIGLFVSPQAGKKRNKISKTKIVLPRKI